MAAKKTSSKVYYYGTGRRKDAVAAVRLVPGKGKITINGKRYIGLGDLEHLRHCLVRDIVEGYDKDKHEMTDYDRGQIEAYTHIMTKIMEDELEECESPDDVKRLRESIRKEWMEGKFVIDADACLDCGACEAACPTGAIEAE